MKKIFAPCSILAVLLILSGCGATLIHQTAQNDFRPIPYSDAKNQVRNIFYEGTPTAGSDFHWIGKSLKLGREGFQVGTDTQISCAYEVMGDPYVKEWPNLPGGKFGVHSNGCDVQVWFRQKESAILFAQLLYTLKQQAGEEKVARNLPGGVIASVESKAATIKTDIDEPPAIRIEPRPNAYAVVIGIENYRGIPKSDYSRRDATLVKSYLKALGFQERNIDFMTDEKATKTDIEKSLQAWLPNRAKNAGLVFIYFSGHGAPEPATGEAYLVPYDGDPGYLPVTGYSLRRLYDTLAKLEAKEIVVVLDSCFSGAGGRSVLAKGARPLVMTASTGVTASNIVVLAATQGSQISTSSPRKGHGVFTYYFLKAVKDGKKTIAEIYETIAPQVEDEAKQQNVEQSPSVSPDIKKLKGKFSLRK